MVENTPEPTTVIVYRGATEQERIASARAFQITQGIIQRFGRAMSDDERVIMNVTLGLYAYEQPVSAVHEQKPAPVETERPVRQPTPQPSKQIKPPK